MKYLGNISCIRSEVDLIVNLTSTVKVLSEINNSTSIYARKPKYRKVTSIY